VPYITETWFEPHTIKSLDTRRGYERIAYPPPSQLTADRLNLLDAWERGERETGREIDHLTCGGPYNPDTEGWIADRLRGRRAVYRDAVRESRASATEDGLRRAVDAGSARLRRLRFSCEERDAYERVLRCWEGGEEW